MEGNLEETRPLRLTRRRRQWMVTALLGLCCCSSVDGFILPRPHSSSLTNQRSRTSSKEIGGGGRRQTITCLLDFTKPPLGNPNQDLNYDTRTGKSVTFKAKRSAEIEVMEGKRSLQDYMALPPSQYSVLDADAIVRLSDDSFRCQISGINFFGYQLVPILYVKVIVDTVNGKSTLNVYKIELSGSRIAEKANGTFQVQARNVVSYHPTHADNTKMMQSTVSVAVDALVPRGNIIPLHVLQKGGSLVIQGILNVMVPRFVKILSKDYEKWSMGDDSRAAVAHEAEESLAKAE